MAVGAQYTAAHWIGVLAAGAAALLVSRFVSMPGEMAGRLTSLWRFVDGRLMAPTSLRLGLFLGGVAAALAAWFGWVALGGHPLLLDGISQLIQARYFADGVLAPPPLQDLEFWQFQFMVQGDAGWTSQYPPGFSVLLAAAWRAGEPWMAGPLLLGVAVCAATWVAERLLPHDRLAARLGSVMMAGSPFLAFHAATYMNHVAALALVALAFLFSLRAVDHSWKWCVPAGVAVGALFAVRPYVGVVLGFVATVLVWARAPGSRTLSVKEWVQRVGGAALGALPFIWGVLWHNARMFGSPWRFGYIAASGPSHGLGFHLDPWQSPYGIPEAVAHASGDLLGMSMDLLQSPVPVVVVVGFFLLRERALPSGFGVVAAWAVLPLMANMFYWHHDLFMGPRLLYEAAPAWCFLLALAVLGLVRSLPGEPSGDRHRGVTRVGGSVILAVAWVMGAGWSGPSRLAANASMARGAGLLADAPQGDGPSLVFVHDDWQSRLGARLSATGMRLDSINGALRFNTTCQVELYTRMREAAPVRSGGSEVALRFQGSAGRLPTEVVMPSGSRVRTLPGEVLAPECEREAASDFGGILPLAPLLWQGDLPGLGTSGAMFVRDFGRERNGRLLRRFPGRRPLVLLRNGRGDLSLSPYEEGMGRVWLGG
ncbi:MAG: hypothetical protein OEZ65_14175 [Gemmatimonadota bacterium]|nr:hypothetical protein [Gemmatimonadota bacterium]